MTEHIAETVSGDWRATMAVPCTCSPDDGSGRCEREQECYEAWSAFQALRIDGKEAE